MPSTEGDKARRELEMSRGAQIAQRAERLTLLQRYKLGKRMQVMVALPGHPLYEHVGQVNMYDVDGVRVFHENVSNDAFPSDALMATLALAIAATTGLDGLPPVEPTHKVPDRAYSAEMRARNAGRPDFA